MTRSSAWPALALLAACHGASDGAAAGSTNEPDGTRLASAFPLQLVSEKKLSKLLPKKVSSEYEASGVTVSNGSLYVAFDNLTQVARIDTTLSRGELGQGEVIESQYEGITATDDGRFYAVVEVVSESDPRGAVAELASDTSFVSQAFTDVSFQHVNKGFEGIAWTRVAGTEYLLALCQNNSCKDDDSTPGKGRILVLALVDGVWTTQTTLKLPETVAFLDYSDLALRENGDGSFTIAVVSHKSSALWLGRLSTSPWALGGASTFCAFPRDDLGMVRYCSVEGVTFLGPQLIATVSDKADGSAPCADEEQSIHVFQLPQ